MGGLGGLDLKLVLEIQSSSCNFGTRALGNALTVINGSYFLLLLMGSTKQVTPTNPKQIIDVYFDISDYTYSCYRNSSSDLPRVFQE